MHGTLRFLLAIAVALSHLGVTLYGYNPGVVAVVIFYMLAGMVSYKLITTIYPNQPLLYYKDRVKRIFNYIGFRFFIAFIVFSILILMAIIIIHISFSKDLQNEKFNFQAIAQSNEKLTFLNSFITKRVNSIKAVSDNPYFQEYINANKYLFNTDFLFYTIMDENKEYMQLRFIDKYGNEQLRFDRKIKNETAYKVSKLQNKRTRYYFKNLSYKQCSNKNI